MTSYSKYLTDEQIAINHKINRYITLGIIIIGLIIGYFF